MKNVLTKKDKEILDYVLRFIGDDDKLEEDIALFIEQESKGELDESDPMKFSRWIRKMNR